MDTTPKISPERTKRQSPAFGRNQVAYLEPGPSSFSLVLIGIGAVIGLSGFWIRSRARRGIGRMAT